MQAASNCRIQVYFIVRTVSAKSASKDYSQIAEGENETLAVITGPVETAVAEQREENPAKQCYQGEACRTEAGQTQDKSSRQKGCRAEERGEPFGQLDAVGQRQHRNTGLTILLTGTAGPGTRSGETAR